MALRSSRIRQLENLLAEAEEVGRSDDVARAAEVILSLSAALNAHDPRTRGHTERVRAYADMLGEELGLEPEERNKLAWAAMLHDIGKLRVPREIINRPGRLGGPDWEIMRNHPQWGMELAAPLLGWLGEYGGAIGQHHERYDGSGYPLGLEGEEVSLAARITAVADAFDVMTSVRSYKDAHPASWAREELARNAGGQFDPVVVRAFLNITIGRQRWVAGPLSWLAQIPVLQGALQGGMQAATTVASSAAGMVQTATVATALAGTLAVAPGALGQLPPPEPVVVSTTTTTSTTPPPSLVVSPDRFTVDEDTPVWLDVLANDVGPVDADSLRVVDEGRGRTIVEGGRVRYSPPAGFSGRDGFTYRVCAADSDCVDETVQLTVREINDPPTGPASRVILSMDGGDALFDPLAGFTDPDGDPIRVGGFDPIAEAGGVIGEGATRYIPPPEWAGTDRFTYLVEDGRGGRAHVTVLVEVGAVPTTTTAARPTTTTTRLTTSAAAATTTTTTTTTTTATTTTTTTTSTTTTTTTATTVPAGAPMLIKSLKPIARKASGGLWEAKVDLKIVDAEGKDVGNAAVTVTWAGAYDATVSAVTKGDGKVTFLSGDMTGEWLTFTVVAVTHPDCIYAPHLNMAVPSATLTNPN